MQQPSFYLPTGNAVFVTGNGPAVVVIGGGPGLSSRIYRNYLVPLIQNRRVVCWDYAAVGSSKPREFVSFEKDYEDLLVLMESVDKKGLCLLAHSYGGLLALRYLLENPKGASKLMLLGAFSHFLPVTGELMQRKMSRLSPQELQELAVAIEHMQKGVASREESDRFTLLEIKTNLANPSPEFVQAAAVDSEFNPRVYGTNVDWINVDYTKKLSEIRVPTWVAVGKLDPIVPPGFSEPLKAIPGSTFTEFENSAHWPFCEEPEAFGRELQSFLER